MRFCSSAAAADISTASTNTTVPPAAITANTTNASSNMIKYAFKPKTVLHSINVRDCIECPDETMKCDPGRLV